MNGLELIMQKAWTNLKLATITRPFKTEFFGVVNILQRVFKIRGISSDKEKRA
jgi:hypothetical protein